MRDAAKRVAVAFLVIQGLFFFSVPFWPSVMPLIRWLPDPLGTLVNMALIGAIVWGGVEIANRFVGRRKKTEIFIPVGGLAPADLTVVLNAKDNLRRVRRAARKIADPQAVAALTELVALGEEGLGALPGAPERLRHLRRPLDYHLPKVAELAEGLAALGASPEQEIRAARITSVFIALTAQLRATRDGLIAPDLRMLDVELKLIESALQGHDVVRAAARIAPATP